MRLGDIGAAVMARAAPCTSTPHAPAAAMAAAALLALWRPAMGKANDTSPHGVAMCTVACARASRLTWVMRTVADGASPKVITRADVRDCIANTRSSSAFKMAMPSLGKASMSSPLAWAMPSKLSSSAVCASAIAVTTPIVGKPTSVSRAISPWPRMPISKMSASQSSGAFSSVIGTPWSLLNERELAATRNAEPMAAAAKSFVVVLPTLPVMPTTLLPTRAPSAKRAQRPSARNASAVSGTTIAVPRNAAPLWPTSREVRYAPAPRANASSIKSWPSRSAIIGTNNCPIASVRESNEAPDKWAFFPLRRPPTACATSVAMKRIRSLILRAQHLINMTCHKRGTVDTSDFAFAYPCGRHLWWRICRTRCELRDRCPCIACP